MIVACSVNLLEFIFLRNKRSKSIKYNYAAMAQSVEHVLGKDGVTGSNPVSSSKKHRLRLVLGVFLFHTFARQEGLQLMV